MPKLVSTKKHGIIGLCAEFKPIPSFLWKNGDHLVFTVSNNVIKVGDIKLGLHTLSGRSWEFSVEAASIVHDKKTLIQGRINEEFSESQLSPTALTEYFDKALNFVQIDSSEIAMLQDADESLALFLEKLHKKNTKIRVVNEYDLTSAELVKYNDVYITKRVSPTDYILI